MSLSTGVTALAQRIATEFNEIRSEISAISGGSSVLDQGTSYYDNDNNYLYVVFGTTGNWESVRFRDNDETTGTQTGTVPTTLTALQTLTYS